VPREQALEGAQANIDESKPEFEIWLDAELQNLAAVVRTAQAGQDINLASPVRRAGRIAVRRLGARWRPNRLQSTSYLGN
jgi:hypothetical protein